MYPSARSIDLNAGIIKGIKTSGITVRMSVGAGSVSWSRIFKRVIAHSCLSCDMVTLLDDVQVCVVQARLVDLHIDEACSR